MVRIHRPPYADLPHSPPATLYGRTEDHLLAPLDLVVMRVEAGEPVYAPPADPGLLRDAPVRDEEGGAVGTIDAYAWPPELPTRVDPVVRIAADGENPEATAAGDAPEPAVSMGDAVRLSSGGERVAGAVTGLLQPRPYPDPGHRADSYRITFSRHLLPVHHGTPVRLAAGRLLGMLIATRNDGDGECHGLVYPAHRI